MSNEYSPLLNSSVLIKHRILPDSCGAFFEDDAYQYFSRLFSAM